MARSDGRVKCQTRGCRNYVLPPTTLCKICRGGSASPAVLPQEPNAPKESGSTPDKSEQPRRTAMIGDRGASLDAAALLLAAGSPFGLSAADGIDKSAKVPKPPRPNSMADIVARRMAAPLFTSPELSKPTRQQRRAAQRKDDLATINRSALKKLSRRERRALVTA